MLHYIIDIPRNILYYLEKNNMKNANTLPENSLNVVAHKLKRLEN